ncbi:hypothetical protein Tco_0308216 [Tanacetum coccineum]
MIRWELGLSVKEFCLHLVLMMPNGQSGSSGPSAKSKLEKTKKAEKGDKHKVVVKDSQSCPWLLHCSKSRKEETWWVKRFDDEHTCLHVCNKDQLQKKFELGVSKAKVFRSKQMAHDKVIGDYVNQYARVKDNALELKEQNPDTTIKIDVYRTYEVTSDTENSR